MRKIENVGNMPSHVAAFAKQLGGMMSGTKETEFWEASSISEFEKNASEIGYEIVPTADMKTGRGFLVGFDVVESEVVGLNGMQYFQMKMYFIEISSAELEAWTKKIKEHRQMQEEDYHMRQAMKKGGLI